MSMALPDFSSIEQALDGIAPSDAHGLLCGLLSRQITSCEQWLAYLQPDQATDVVLELEPLQALYQITRAQLSDEQLGFSLLLPPDHCALARRSEALGAWCQGFMYGFGLGGALDMQQLAEDPRDFLHDLQKLAQIEFTAEESSEEDELAYNEVVEYVRVGVLLVRQELLPPPTVQLH